MAATLAIQTFAKKQDSLLIHLSEDGQHVRADLHQQDGWNSITETQPAHRRTKVLVPGKEYHHLCLTSSSLSQLESGRGIKDHERPVGLEDLPGHLRESSRSIWSHGDRPIRVETDKLILKQLPTYVSWWPDPEAVQTDAFSMNWKGLKAHANSPWNLTAQVVGQVRQLTGGNHRTGNSSVEDSSMVCPSARVADQGATVIPLDGRTDSANTPSQSPEPKLKASPHLVMWHISEQDSGFVWRDCFANLAE